MHRLHIKPNHKAIQNYYATLKGFDQLQISHEMAVKIAFQQVLESCGKQFGYVLVPEWKIRRAKQNPISIDGALVDSFRLPHGFWEAKDIHDNLEKEVKKKFAAGYPADNIIFQSPEHAILYRDGKCIFDDDIRKPESLIHVLKEFVEYAPPAYVEWETAVAEFGGRVPELANGLVELIETERRQNLAFRSAFNVFFELCKASLNPNLSEKVVEDMLIQHLLTERIFRKVFDNPDFAQRNIIAHEIEKVISALTSREFNRDKFLKKLDRFYGAIETTASTIEDFSHKQGFLNSVYEKFFQGFSVKIADTHGIVYTPQPIVTFMINSVVEILDKEFGKSLSDAGVHILDPFVGTGNFIIHIMEQIKKSALSQKYEHELHCNEIMLLPYYIASLNIEHQYFEAIGKYKPFEGICLVDTFELAEAQQGGLFTAENTERVQRQKRSPITIIVGNPPYNANQQNEMDLNKNRQHFAVDEAIRQTYIKDAKKPLSRKAIQLHFDPYIKAIKWASDTIKDEGIVAFVTNSSFAHEVSFDGLRKHLAKDFSSIYILDLGGNIRKNPKLSGTTHNVFGIQVGVSINFFIRKAKSSGMGKIYYGRVDEFWRKEQKYEFLNSTKDYSHVKWQLLHPDKSQNWLTEDLNADFQGLIALGDKQTKGTGTLGKVVFNTFALGVSTNKDSWLTSFDPEDLRRKVKSFIETYNSDLDKWIRHGKPENIFEVVTLDKKKIKWSSLLIDKFKREHYATYSDDFIRISEHRPFTKMYLYFDKLLVDVPTLQSQFFPSPETEAENVAIWLKIGADTPYFALAINHIPNLMTQGGSQSFPFYTYSEDGTRRHENISDWALDEFRTQYDDKKIVKWDIFYYIYGLFHHPEYRKRYEANLRRELPRIPLLKDFWAVCKSGKQLCELHSNYDQLPEYKLQKVENSHVPLNFRVTKMKLSKDRTGIIYNEFLTIQGIPLEAYEYHLGDRSALDWIIDQYDISVDKKGGSGIIRDPNRLDDPEYIIRLIGKIVTLSLRTMKIIKNLPRFELLSTRKPNSDDDSAFGIWEKRHEIKNSSEWVQKQRALIEKRRA